VGWRFPKFYSLLSGRGEILPLGAPHDIASSPSQPNLLSVPHFFFLPYHLPPQPRQYPVSRIPPNFIRFPYFRNPGASLSPHSPAPWTNGPLETLFPFLSTTGLPSFTNAFHLYFFPPPSLALIGFDLESRCLPFLSTFFFFPRFPCYGTPVSLFDRTLLGEALDPLFNLFTRLQVLFHPLDTLDFFIHLQAAIFPPRTGVIQHCPFCPLDRDSFNFPSNP